MFIVYQSSCIIDCIDSFHALSFDGRNAYITLTIGNCVCISWPIKKELLVCSSFFFIDQLTQTRTNEDNLQSLVWYGYKITRFDHHQWTLLHTEKLTQKEGILLNKSEPRETVNENIVFSVFPVYVLGQ